MVFSGMNFRDFGAENCFRIEYSRLYQKSLSHLGFKSVEFVTYHAADDEDECKLVFVEAKTTLKMENTEIKFADEITDISQKFMDDLQIVCGVWHGGRRGKVPLPSNFTEFRERGNKIVFILVIKNSKESNLLFVRDAIKKHLLKEYRLWRFDVTVLNEELALKENLVLAGDAS